MGIPDVPLPKSPLFTDGVMHQGSYDRGYDKGYADAVAIVDKFIDGYKKSINPSPSTLYFLDNMRYELKWKGK